MWVVIAAAFSLLSVLFYLTSHQQTGARHVAGRGGRAHAA